MWFLEREKQQCQSLATKGKTLVFCFHPMLLKSLSDFWGAVTQESQSVASVRMRNAPYKEPKSFTQFVSHPPKPLCPFHFQSSQPHWFPALAKAWALDLAPKRFLNPSWGPQFPARPKAPAEKRVV